MPHPGQAFLKNDAKRKREYEIRSKNCRENIKRWKQSADRVTYTILPCLWVNRYIYIYIFLYYLENELS